MATTNFVDGQTVIEAAWLNDVDEAVYNPASVIIPATSVTNTPAGSIAAVTVQAAIDELDAEKQPLDNELTALATSTAAANKIPYFTGTTTASTLDWNSATALADSATTISSNTVIKAYADNLVVSTTTAASVGSEDYIIFEDATDSTQKKTLIGSAVAEALNATGSAPMYACRAWATFNGTGTPTMAASGNFNSSITDNGAGDWTLTFTTAMPDANYACSVTISTNGYPSPSAVVLAKTTTTIRIGSQAVSAGSGVSADATIVDVLVFR